MASFFRIVEELNSRSGVQVGDFRGAYLSSPPEVYSTTDEEVQRQINDEEDRKVIGSILKYGITAGVIASVKKILENQEVQRKIQSQINLTYLDESIRSSNMSGLEIFGGRLTLTNMAMEAARRVEELSPFSILRTFQMSHFMQPFASKNAEFDITSEMIMAQRRYYEDIVSKYGNRSLTEVDLREGFRVSGGKLLDRSGNSIIDNVRGVATEFGGDSHDQNRSFVNRILRRHLVDDDGVSRKALNQVFDLNKQDGLSRLTVIAGTSQSDIEKKWVKSAVSAGFAQGFNIVNEPLGFINELAGTAIGEQNIPAPFRGVMNRMKINPHASMDSSIRDLFSGYIRHGAAKTAIAAGAFYALDNAAKVFGTEGTGFDKGVVEGLATTYVSGKLTYAEAIGDSFSEYREEQEYVAPKSTSLLNLAGLPLAGAMLGGTIAYGQRLGHTAITRGGYEEALQASQHIDNVISSRVTQMTVGSSSAFSTLGLASRGRRYATRGALVGALLAAPFIPGALIGQNSEDIKDEYFGNKEVAIRSNAYWFSGSTEYEGTGIKYFARNWYQRLMADSKDKVLYGDGDTKEDLNPFLSPFDYLRNPYRLEEMHKEDMPYPVWGMDVSYGGWAGKIFERTIGQIIKPDIVNTEALDQLATDSRSMEMYSKRGGSSGYVSTGPSLSIREDGETIHQASSDLDNISIPVNESNRTISLIDDGLMLRQRNLSYDPNEEAAQYIYNAGLDYIGLKGWAVGMLSDNIGIMDRDYSNQLARSGESTNAAREFMSHNAGGLFGAADILRRIVPMSSDVMYDRSNPLSNSVSPSWLPNDSSRYYTDFSKGDFWQSVERGYERLPGVGYTQYYSHLEGVDPEEYSDIDKFRIISDVAYGSTQYYNMNEYMSNKFQSGEMSEEEMLEYSEIYEQSQLRSQKKNFYEYKTDEDLEGVSLWGQALNAIWEPVTHNAELPTESLTFFRPAGKLLHQRTAIEDYKKTQILGTDTAMWDRPIDHFIKPFINNSAAIVNDDFIPQETIERRNVDAYFDSLEYYKQMKVYRENVGVNGAVAAEAKRRAGKTIRGSIASGLDNQQEILNAYSALSSEEKAYFSSFVNAREDDRSTISNMLDGNTARMYEMMWSRKDASEDGISPEEIAHLEEQELINSNRAAYEAYNRSGDSNIGISFSEYMQEQYARNELEETTGIPDETFIGWDPRIDTKDVKLRTLMVGKDDVRRYGYWESDESELRRQIGILSEDQVTMQLNSIKKSRAQNVFEHEAIIKEDLYRRGLVPDRIKISNVGNGDFNLNIN